MRTGRALKSVLMAFPDDGGVGHVARRCAQQLAAEGVNVIPVPTAGTGAVAWAGMWEGITRCRQIRRVDVVHVELGLNARSTFWFAVVASTFRNDLVVVAHDGPVLVTYPAAGLLPSRRGWYDRVAYRLLSPMLDAGLRRWVRRRAASWVVLTQAAAASLRQHGMSPVTVVHHGADPPASIAGAVLPSQGTDIVLAGVLGPGKGVDLLRRAWALVGASSPLRLVIAGSAGTANARWYNLERELFDQLPHPPQWVGFLSDSEFDALIARSAIVVLPYKRSNPVSGIAVRATVHGRPIVGTRVRALQDYVEDGVTGLLSDPDDHEALAGSLRALIDEPARRDILGAAAAHIGQGHSWRTHVLGLRRAYAVTGVQ